MLAPTRALLPTAPIVYVADNAGYPYGTKTDAELAERLHALFTSLVAQYRPRLAVIACNTASTIALGMVRDVLAVPIVGTVPAIKPAAEQTRTGTIGLLGTAATIRQGYVDRLEAEFASDQRLLRFAAPELVGAAEAKLRGQAVDPAIFARAAAGLRDQPGGAEIDTVVLACTHFPLLAAELTEAFGPQVRFVDGAAGIARRIAYLTRGQPFERTAPDFALFTRTDENLELLAPALARYGLSRMELL